ncbi:unnamed protein product, partial [Polarella glacialis]
DLNVDWVHVAKAGNWVSLLSGWAAEFPSAGSSDSDWQTFLVQSLELPVILSLAGAAIAAATLWALCRCHMRARTASPPWILFLLVCLGTLACFVTGIYLCAVEGQRGFHLASSNLALAAEHATAAQAMAEDLNISGTSFVRNLDRLYVECPKSTHEFLRGSVMELKVEVSGYLDSVARYASSLQGVPEQLALAEQQSHSVDAFVSLCLGLPIAVVSLCYMTIGLLVAVAECSGAKCARRCSFFQLPCVGATCVAPAVLLVALVSAMELSVGIVSSAFCSDADVLTLAYAEDFWCCCSMPYTFSCA